jgi:Spy/CpxP family protein refolding chaperone
MGFVARQLDLTDNQKSQIKTIWEGERPNIAEVVRELASEQKEMDALTFHDGAPDEARHFRPSGGDTREALSRKGKDYGQDLLPGSESRATHESG